MSTRPTADELPEDRTARHLQLCRRLADLALALAEHAAAELLSAPDPALEPSPEAPRRAAEPALTFTRMARCVRETVALEARIAAQAEARRKPWPAPSALAGMLRPAAVPAPAAKPRREPLYPPPPRTRAADWAKVSRPTAAELMAQLDSIATQAAEP